MANNTSEQEENFGGHDYNFIDTVLNRHKCTVCTKVLRDPELTVCCGQHFCGTCLLQWFKSQHKKSCPHCRAEGPKFQHVENKSLKSEINQLQISCSKLELGCDWTGELGDLKEHLKAANGCSFAMVQCTNKCGSSVTRSNLSDHMSNECKLRQDTCQYCSKQDTFSAICEHKSVCPKFPLLCPNGCSSDTVCREEMPDHLTVCPLQKVVCPFEDIGCTTRVKPEKLNGHMETSQQQHILLLLKANKEMRSELQKTNTTLQQAEQEFHEMKEKQTREGENVTRMKKALAFEVKVLDESDSNDKKSTAYESIQTLLEDETHIMKKEDTTVFRVVDFSQHVKDNKIWYSPPFFIQQYKLCLAVHPRGIGSGLGTHASLSLILLEVGSSPPTEGGDPSTLSSLLSSVHVLVPLFKLGNKVHRIYLSGICGNDMNLTPLADGEDKRTLGTRGEWLNHGIISNELCNDSLAIKIERAGTFVNLHSAALAHAAAQAAALSAAQNAGECRQS